MRGLTSPSTRFEPLVINRRGLSIVIWVKWWSSSTLILRRMISVSHQLLWCSITVDTALRRTNTCLTEKRRNEENHSTKLNLPFSSVSSCFLFCQEWHASDKCKQTSLPPSWPIQEMAVGRTCNSTSLKILMIFMHAAWLLQFSFVNSQKWYEIFR